MTTSIVKTIQLEEEIIKKYDNDLEHSEEVKRIANLMCFATNTIDEVSTLFTYTHCFAEFLMEYCVSFPTGLATRDAIIYLIKYHTNWFEKCYMYENVKNISIKFADDTSITIAHKYDYTLSINDISQDLHEAFRYNFGNELLFNFTCEEYTLKFDDKDVFTCNKANKYSAYLIEDALIIL